MLTDYTKWQELRAWAEDKVRLETQENAVFFVLLLSKMSQLDTANHWSTLPISRGPLQDMYPDTPFDGEDY